MKEANFLDIQKDAEEILPESNRIRRKRIAVSLRFMKYF